MGMDNIFYLKSRNQRYTVWSLPRSAAYVDYHVQLHITHLVIRRCYCHTAKMSKRATFASYVYGHN
jgi:hypothetical protein